MTRTLPLCFVVLLAALFATGCGPIMSTQLILDAQADLDGATAAEAERYAAYELTAAREYLYKAREEQGYADFGPSIDYAQKAGRLARQARERAMKERARAEPPPSRARPGASAPDGDAPPTAPRVLIRRRSPPGPASPAERAPGASAR